MPYSSFYEELLRNKVHILLCKILKIYDAICPLVLRRGFLIRFAILVLGYTDALYYNSTCMLLYDHLYKILMKYMCTRYYTID